MRRNTSKGSPNHRLREAREACHWSQQEVADRIGATGNTVSRWELGQTTPSPYFRAKLSALFAQSAEALGLVDEHIATAPAFLVNGSTTMLYSAERQKSVWYVPHPRNALFTGREDLLHHLHERLHQQPPILWTQSLAISGLGGIGKTQTALEYVYRFAQQYQAILWVSAETRETLLADFVAIAHIVALPNVGQQAPEQVVDAIKQWLMQQEHWLLVFDNVEDLGLIQPFLPMRRSGHIIFTTRLQATGTLAHRLDLERMEPEEGAIFLLRRAKLVPANALIDNVPAPLRTLAHDLCELLDGLPLALDQAGAFVEETACSLAAYRELYEHHAAALHAWQSQSTSAYPHAVSTTFALSFQRVERTLPIAADLLRLCTFLHPDAIPEELLSLAAIAPASPLAPLASDPLLLNQALAVLMQQSLLKRHPDAQILMIHRLVQTVLKEQLDQASYQYWAHQAVEVVNQSFPVVEELTTWQQCQRLLPHALTCLKLIEDEAIVSLAAGRLLHQTGIYLLEQAQYSLAERCICRALHIRTHLQGEQHPEVAESLNILAELCYFQGAYEQAKAIHWQVLSIRQQWLGSEHLDVATSLNNLAGVLCMQGEYEEAEPLYQQALHLRKQILGPDHLDVAESLQNLGYLYMQQARYGQAEPLYLRCLSICERLLERDHGYLTTILNNLGTLYRRQGHLEQAERYYQQALIICQRRFSSEHPHLAQIYVNLAELFIVRGVYSLAESWYQRAVQIQERTLGSKHPRTVQSWQKLALLYRAQGLIPQAERIE